MSAQEPRLVHTEAACPCCADGSLPPIDVSIEKGRPVLLCGADGEQISSYLEMLGGVSKPCSGRVQLLHQDTREIDLDHPGKLRRKVGYVLRGGPLVSSLNGVQNLKLAARYHQVGDDASQQERLESLLEGFLSATELGLLPAYLSRVQRRLLAFARPLMLDPEIVMLDHPLDGLNRNERSEVSRFLERIVQRESIGMILCSEDVRDLRSVARQFIYCDREAVMTYTSWPEFHAAQQPNIESFSATEMG